MKTLLITLFFSALALNLSAQQSALTPANNPINANLVTSENYEMTWYVLNGSTKIEIGTVATEIQKNKDDLLIITTVNMKRSPAPWVDSTVAKLPNFAPVHHSSYNMQRDMVLNFGNTVTGYYLDKKTNSKTAISETTVGGYFDSNLYPQLIRWLPLKQGYEKTIRIFDYSPKSNGVMNAYIKNVAAGTLGSKKVWLVTATDDISANKAISTYYIDKKTRQVLKHEIDMGGRKMVMELNK